MHVFNSWYHLFALIGDDQNNNNDKLQTGGGIGICMCVCPRTGKYPCQDNRGIKYFIFSLIPRVPCSESLPGSLVPRYVNRE